ncbi:glycosyltransferase family 2 protein [Trichlorobacter lovleyi]|uniref:glycosyltransferase family 2 protein n=1 Tax=Trichlorobacter lovleyi TaxID=313985 RepID=UPI003D12ED85
MSSVSAIVRKFQFIFIAILDNLLKLVLSRKNLSVKLLPEQNIVSDNENGWWITNTPAYFALQIENGLYHHGWFYIEGVLHRYSLTRAKLYYNDGTGFSTDNYFFIPVTRRGYIREVIFLPLGVIGLRWAPVDSSGFFIQQSFSIARITYLEALLRALYRVLYDFKRFFRVAERRVEAVKKLLRPLLHFKLWQAYRNTIDFRVFDTTSRTCDELWHAYQASLQQLLPQLTTHALSLKDHPLISVVVSLPELSEEKLGSLICSLQQQIYPHWELIVYSDGNEFCDQCLDMGVDCSDTRLIIINSESGEAWKRAQGRYIVVLGSDVLLEPQALFRVTQTFTTTNAGVLYGDVAQVDPEGETVVGFNCRPAFSPELLRCYPYVDDLLAFDCSFPEGYKPPADSSGRLIIHDMLLQAYITGAEVAHVAEFLCKKKYHSEPAEQVCTTYNLKSDLRVAIIIPTKNAAELVKQCIESLERTISTGAIPYTIIVVDHASDDPAALQYFNELSELHCVLRYEGDFNFSTINNWAVGQLTENYTHYLFCNNDIEAFHNGWLETMLGFGQQDDVGVVGAQLLYPDKLHIQHAGVCVGLHGLAEHYGKFLSTDEKYRELLHADAQIALTSPHEVSAVTAACMLVRRDAFEKVGGFDEQMAVGFGDVDLCLRIGEAGYRIIYSPDSSFVHHESLTRGKDMGDPHPEDTIVFKKRWKSLLENGDPFYHPAYSCYSFNWQYVDPLPCRFSPSIRMVCSMRGVS